MEAGEEEEEKKEEEVWSKEGRWSKSLSFLVIPEG